jgi:type II secretory pathway component GspD/PulD (secretin)
VLANTRIVTKNNKEAYLSAVERIPLHFTDHDGHALDPWDHLFEAGMHVAVTPNIQQDSLINMIITPRISDLTGWSPKGLPMIFERSLKTEILAPNNSVFVLGGLKKKEKVTVRTGIPGLKNIPVIKYLFSVKKDVLLEREVLIFIRPSTDILAGAGRSEADKALERSEKATQER